MPVYDGKARPDLRRSADSPTICASRGSLDSNNQFNSTSVEAKLHFNQRRKQCRVAPTSWRRVSAKTERRVSVTSSRDTNEHAAAREPRTTPSIAADRGAMENRQAWLFAAHRRTTRVRAKADGTATASGPTQRQPMRLPYKLTSKSQSRGRFCNGPSLR